MPKLTFDSKARADVVEALKPYAEQMFTKRDSELTVIATFTPVGWTEAIKSKDEEEWLEVSIKVAVTDAEVVTGPHKEAAEAAARDARTQRESAGALIEGAFE